MNILVTGGAGFIGSHLCEALLLAGHRVTALDNFLTGSPANVAHLRSDPAFDLIEADVTNPLPSVSVDAAFHLASAASPEGYGRHPIETLMTNSIGTSNVLQLVHAQRARFLLASTSEVYGDPQEHPQTETYWGHVNPIGPRACYDEGKRFAEALTITYLREKRVDARIIRIFNTYGPRNHPDDGRVIPNFVSQALLGTPLTVYGQGHQTRSFCYVSDLVEGIIRAMFSAGTTGEVFNLGNPEEYSVRVLAERVKAMTRSPSTIKYLSSRPEEIARRRPDITKAGAVLGWAPTVTLDEGLTRTIPWVRQFLAARAAAAGRRGA